MGMAELPHSDIPNLSIRDKLDAALLIDQGCLNHQARSVSRDLL